MYTVLILAQKTMNDFNEFSPLMSEFVQNGNIGICRWEPNGTSLDTAVPDLCQLVKEKKEWRAVIVCTDPGELKGYETSRFNPFDYLENQSRIWMDMKDGEILQSRIPLIRLTHILGGVPVPNPGYEEYYADENNKRICKVKDYHENDEELSEEEEIRKKESQLLHVVYLPVECEEEKKAQKKWVKEHYLPFVAPTEIMMAFVRDRDEAFDVYNSVQMSWKKHMEIDSSQFWLRNTYPQNCRFLIYDFTHRGEMYHKEELFRFWCGILLLCVNRVDPDLIQAHRLYSIDVELNEEELKRSFETTAARINSRRYQLEQQVSREKTRLNSAGDEIPEFKRVINVNFKKAAPEAEDETEFGLFRDNSQNDLSEWKQFRDSVLGSVTTMVRRTERVLDLAAAEYRENSEFRNDEVQLLNEFQVNEMEQSLDEIVHRILKEQSELPSAERTINEEVEEADREVVKELRRRVTKGHAGSIVIFGILTMIIFTVSGFFSPGVNRLHLALATGAYFLAVLAVVFIGLLMHHRHLENILTNFRSSLMNSLSEISQNAGKYSAFISDIASHVHGRSYLDIMDEQVRSYSNNEFLKRRKIKEIDIFRDTLSMWNTALHLDANIDATDMDMIYSEKTRDDNKLTQLDAGKNFRIPVGRSGFYIISPYGFVKKMEIEREESYDDISE